MAEEEKEKEIQFEPEEDNLDNLDSVEKNRRGVPGRPFREDVIKHADVSMDRLCRETYVNVRENRRVTKQLLMRCMKGLKQPSDYGIMGVTLTKFLETLTSCDKILIELAKVKMNEEIKVKKNEGDIYDTLVEQGIIEEDTKEKPKNDSKKIN